MHDSDYFIFLDLNRSLVQMRRWELVLVARNENNRNRISNMRQKIWSCLHKQRGNRFISECCSSKSPQAKTDKKKWKAWKMKHKQWPGWRWLTWNIQKVYCKEDLETKERKPSRRQHYWNNTEEGAGKVKILAVTWSQVKSPIYNLCKQTMSLLLGAVSLRNMGDLGSPQHPTPCRFLLFPLVPNLASIYLHKPIR